MDQREIETLVVKLSMVAAALKEQGARIAGAAGRRRSGASVVSAGAPDSVRCQNSPCARHRPASCSSGW